MIGSAVPFKQRPKAEAEKPFWISYADLMTALMVLFLVAMSVAMMEMTKTLDNVQQQNVNLEATKKKLLADEELLKAQAEELKKYQKTAEERARDEAQKEQEKAIVALMKQVQAAAAAYPGVLVDTSRRTIDFGNRAQFEKNSYSLTPDQSKLLRAFVPEVLTIAGSELGRKWIKQVVVEGFASPVGDYLYNLNLSLQRSQRVLCALMAPALAESSLQPDQIEQIRDLFLVGGYSFNATKFDKTTNSFDASRRVELRLEFLAPLENRPSVGAGAPNGIGKCALN